VYVVFATDDMFLRNVDLWEPSSLATIILLSLPELSVQNKRLKISKQQVNATALN